MLPTKPEVNSFSQSGWTFTSTKTTMMPSKELDNLQNSLNLHCIPDVVFHKNFLQMKNEEKNFTIFVGAIDALKFCNFEYLKNHYEDYKQANHTEDLKSINYIPEKVKVAVSKFWANKKAPEDVEIEKIEVTSDWTYTTPYKGTICDTKDFQKCMSNYTLNDLDCIF